MASKLIEFMENFGPVNRDRQVHYKKSHTELVLNLNYQDTSSRNIPLQMK